MQISKNFTLEELLKSSTADRWEFKEQYQPSIDVIEALKQVVVHIAQPIRDIINKPLKVTSGYRCPRVNAKVGGASTKDASGKVKQTSGHVLGNSLDLECWVSGIEANNLILDALRELMKDPKFEWDQIVIEHGTMKNPSWVHVSYRKNNNRKQILRKETGKPYYNIKL